MTQDEAASGQQEMPERTNRMALRSSMIQALDLISREASAIADVLRSQQEGEKAGTPLAITTYYSTMDDYLSRYAALCHAWQKEVTR